MKTIGERVNRFNLNARCLSEAFWTTLFSKDQRPTDRFIRGIYKKHRKMLEEGGYNVNIMPSVTEAQCLASVVSYFQPERIVEIGTGSGFTSAVMAAAKPDIDLHTCDMDIKIPDLRTPGVSYYTESSTKMLESLNIPANKLSVDMFFFDGRILIDDLPHIRELAGDEVLYVFDDFEGIEKGASNAAFLADAGLFPILMYPEWNSRIAVGLKHVNITKQ